MLIRNRVGSLLAGVVLLLANATVTAEKAATTETPETSRTLKLSEVRQKYATPASRFVDIGSINIHYRDEGEGPVVFLLHGTLGDLTDWDEWTEELKSDFRIIRMDLPGFGLSGDIPNGNYSVERSHVLIDGLMDHLSIDRFGVVGISYGGMVMFRYASTRVDRVTSMILVNSAGIQFGKPPKADKSSTKPRKNMFIEPVVTEQDVMDFYKVYVNDESRRTPALIQRKLDFLNIEGRLDVAKAALRFYERGDPKHILSHVRAPSLIMWGTGNQALDTTTAQTFVDYLVNACSVDLVTFDEGGHYINLERPEDTAKAAHEFLLELKNNPAPACANSCYLK